MKCRFCQKEVDFDEARHMSISGFRWDEHQKCVPRLRKLKESQTPQGRAEGIFNSLGIPFRIVRTADDSTMVEGGDIGIDIYDSGEGVLLISRDGKDYIYEFDHGSETDWDLIRTEILAARTALGKGNPYP